MTYLLLFLAFQLIRFVAFGGLVKKAGDNEWKTLVPVLGELTILKMIQRPWWWLLLMYAPIVGYIMYSVVVVESLQVFKRRTFQDHLLGIVSLGLYLRMVSMDEKTTFAGPELRGFKGKGRDWTEAIVFAIVAATVIRTFTIEAYTIPTSSMEKSMMIGDFLFVSKVNYGPRLPMTPLSVPLVHNTIPMTQIPSFVEWIKVPYYRLPGFAKIKNKDIVVFNYPMDPDLPIDKKTNYIKRCVGIPGDTLEVIDAVLHINGSAVELPERARPQFAYSVITNRPLSKKEFEALSSERDITEGGVQNANMKEFAFLLTEENAGYFRNDDRVKDIQPIVERKEQFQEAIFPQSRDYPWNPDQYGPIYIPKKGVEIELTDKNYVLYDRLISVYEGHSFERTEDGFLIDGVESTTYTPELDYYWMMGDNRHYSLDSRFWGYVPENHIVGKAAFVWMSFNKYGSGINKIRWNRLFTFIHGKGVPISFFPYFLVLLIGWWGYKKFIRKPKADAAE